MCPRAAAVRHVHVHQTRCTNFIGYIIHVNIDILQTIMHSYENLHIHTWCDHNKFVCVHVYKIYISLQHPNLICRVMNIMVLSGATSVVWKIHAAKSGSSKCCCKFLTNLTLGRPLGTCVTRGFMLLVRAYRCQAILI